MDFESFKSDIQANGWNVYGVEVYEGGNLKHTYGDTLDTIHNIYSATKAVLSIAVGIASDEGIFDISKSVLYYLPKKNVEKLSQDQLEVFEKITIQRLLTMSVTDFPFRPEGDSFIDFALNTKVLCSSSKEAYNFFSLTYGRRF